MIPTGRVLEVYDDLCKVIGARGNGLTLHDMAGAHALARAIAAGDEEKVEEFRVQLDLSEEEMAP